MPITRRRFLTTLGSAGAALVTAGPLERTLAAAQRTTLIVTTSTVEVLGRTVERLDLVQPNGTRGVETVLGARFRVQLVNRISKPTLIHWHGLILPPRQDGVPIISQPALPPGQSYEYGFPLVESGTYWMHSHEGLQEQSLLSAPLIIADPADERRDEQPVVAEIADFSFTDPEQIYAGLRKPTVALSMAPGAPMKPDVNDVNYDAFLVNRRPIENPEVFRIEPRAKVRLRIINSGASTNFTIDLGSLQGTLFAVDGRAITPITGNRFPIGIANRCDIRVETPGPGVYPIFAVREADNARAAFVLATRGASIPKYPAKGSFTAPLNTLALERTLRATNPLSPRPVDRRLTMDLTGDMAKYSWSINNIVWTDALAESGKFPYLPVKRGERVEITMRNKTMMTHPMHLHGHAFQIVAINGERFPGAMRDTIIVTAKDSVTIAFDANNPGWWFYHCHNLYHLAAGMATSLKYV
ncbi:MAG TPA: multicopper oxidase family protein [Candidatus Cybelea sp.]|jgi:FtsP/CotA-like multicopper oxidase with cupredoxin domain